MFDLQKNTNFHSCNLHAFWQYTIWFSDLHLSRWFNESMISNTLFDKNWYFGTNFKLFNYAYLFYLSQYYYYYSTITFIIVIKHEQSGVGRAQTL